MFKHAIVTIFVILFGINSYFRYTFRINIKKIKIIAKIAQIEIYDYICYK
jgi:hypothetical protein